MTKQNKISQIEQVTGKSTYIRVLYGHINLNILLIGHDWKYFANLMQLKANNEKTPTYLYILVPK